MHRWKTLRRKRPKPSALPSLTNPSSSVTETAPAGSHTTPQLDGRRESAFPSGGARAASASDPDSKGIKSPSRESGSSEGGETKDQRTDYYWLNQESRQKGEAETQNYKNGTPCRVPGDLHSSEVIHVSEEAGSRCANKTQLKTGKPCDYGKDALLALPMTSEGSSLFL